MQIAATQAQPVPAARFCLAIEEQREAIRELTLDVKARVSRVEMMADIVKEIAGTQLVPSASADRIRVLGEIIEEAAYSAGDELRRIEIATEAMSKALCGEAGHA